MIERANGDQVGSPLAYLSMLAHGCSIIFDGAKRRSPFRMALTEMDDSWSLPH